MRRGAEKTRMLHQAQAQQASSPLSVNDLRTITPKNQYRRLQLQGRFLNDKSFLLDNKVYNHAVGYHVLTPFEPTSQPTRWIIVDRGFIKAPLRREELPAIVPVAGQKIIVTRVYFPPRTHFHVSDEIESETWPKRVQHVNFTLFKRILGHELTPFVAILQPRQPGMLVYNHPIVNLSPAKHYGYAVQWFLLALVAFIVLIRANLRKRTDYDK